MQNTDRTKNLKPFTKDNAALIGARGGRKSGITKREKKTMREELEYLLSLPDDELDGVTQRTAVLISMIRQAKNGSVRASEFLRDTLGEKPIASEKKPISGNIVVRWASEAVDVDAVEVKQEALPEVV